MTEMIRQRWIHHFGPGGNEILAPFKSRRGGTMFKSRVCQGKRKAVDGLSSLVKAQRKRIVFLQKVSENRLISQK